MECTYCGTGLPEDALFCGECGRAVVGAQAQIARIARASVRDASGHDVPPPSPADRLSPTESREWHTGPRALLCEQCGTAMAPDDIFCGECGNVSKSVSDSFGLSRDTAVIDRAVIDPLSLEGQDADSSAEDSVIVTDAPAEESENWTPPEAIPQPAPFAPGSPAVEPFAPSTPGTGSPSVLSDDDIESTRIVPARGAGERFILQFSTAESFTVYGTGLIGRNPQPEPGEYFDQVVKVLDPSRSVSKTHLEFGQEGGAFWIKDRFSGNGTILREPDESPVRCLPEKRYRVVRGARVEIGEQFFIVS